MSYLGSVGDVFASGRSLPGPSGPVLSRGAIATIQQARDYARASYAACVAYAAGYGTAADLEVAAELYHDVATVLAPPGQAADTLEQFHSMLADADEFVDQYRGRKGIPAPGASGGGPGYVQGSGPIPGPAGASAGFGGWLAALLAGAAFWAFGGGAGKKRRA